MADLQELVLKVRADVADANAKLDQLVRKTQDSSHQMESSFNVARDALKEFGLALSAGALIEFTKHSIEAGAELWTLSQNSGVAVETLSALSEAAKDNGTNINAVAQGFKFLQRNISEAMQGNAQAIQSFNQIGLSAQNLAKMQPLQQLLSVADRISMLGSAADKTKVLMDLLGRSGVELGGLMSQGAEGIRAAMDQAERLGFITSAEEAHRMDEFNRKWTTFVDQCTRLAQLSFLGISDLITRAAGSLATALDPMAAHNLDEVNEALEYLNKEKSQFEQQIASGGDKGIVGWLFGEGTDQAKKNLADVNEQIAYLQKMKDNFERSAQNTDTPSKKTPLKLTIAPNPDANMVKDFIDKLQQQNDVLQVAKEEQAGLAAYYQILDEAKKKHIQVTEIEKEQIMELANSNRALAESQQDAAREARHMQEEMSDSLTKLVFDFKSATDAATGFFKTIAESIVKKQITDPLSSSITGMLSGSSGGIFGSIGKFLGINSTPSGGMLDSDFSSFLNGINLSGARASGGPVGSGLSYLVGENGPEIFTPNMSGNITPNNKIGGSSVQITQIINVQPGVPELIDAKIRQAAPVLAAQSLAAFKQDIQSGGSTSRLIGLRA